MKNAMRTAVCLILCLLATAVFSPGIQVAQALDTESVVLLVCGDPKQLSADDSASLLAKIGTQFKFPKYEILKGNSAPPGIIDRAALEKVAETSGADGVVIIDIKRYHAIIRPGYVHDDLYEDTTVDLSLHYFNKKTGQAGQFDGYRSLCQLFGPDSGALPVTLGVLDKMLDKLDKVFPRQFPGPRY